MIFNQTVNLDSNGNPVSTPISDDHVISYVTEFVSNKSSFYNVIMDSNYQITIDLAVMELEGIYNYLRFNFKNYSFNCV